MLRIRYFLIVLTLICFSSRAFSQSLKVPNLANYDKSPYHFGFLLGVNQMFFTVNTYPGYQNIMYYNNDSVQSIPDQSCDSANLYNVEPKPALGFVIGIIGNLRLGDHFDFRFTPSLTFGERDLVYTLKSYNDYSPDPEILVVTKNIQSTFVDFPLMIKYKGNRIQNVRPYIMAGAKYSIDLASNAKKKAENSAAHVFINRKDVYAIGGFGFDFYTAYFKFGTEISMSYGLFDILKHDNTIYTQAIERMSSRIFQISFTFE